MMSRMIWIAVVPLVACAMVGCPQLERTKASAPSETKARKETQKPERPEGVVGYYILDVPAFYGATDMKSVPSGTVMLLGIEEGRWMVRNMLSGFGGTWVRDKDGATLTVSEGPTGKTDGKERMKATPRHSPMPKSRNF